MSYSADNLEQFRNNYTTVVTDLQSVMFEGLKQSEPLTNEPARRQLRHGVGRRLSVLKKSVEKIFELFPPSQERPLQREVLTEVQIYLHAFVINLAGVFDNWAWSFLFRHDLVQEVERRNVSLFKRETQRFLPNVLREYLTSADIAAWHQDYLKGYRDALAHRIPLYIPPASWTVEDSQLYERLETEKIECIRRGEWDRLDDVWAKQDAVGRSCPLFLHEFSDDEQSKPLYLHPQMLSDGMTVAEFGKRYYAAWHEHA